MYKVRIVKGTWPMIEIKLAPRKLGNIASVHLYTVASMNFSNVVFPELC
jgi:hypothetical protein